MYMSSKLGMWKVVLIILEGVIINSVLKFCYYVEIEVKGKRRNIPERRTRDFWTLGEAHRESSARAGTELHCWTASSMPPQFCILVAIQRSSLANFSAMSVSAKLVKCRGLVLGIPRINP